MLSRKTLQVGLSEQVSDASYAPGDFVLAGFAEAGTLLRLRDGSGRQVEVVIAPDAQDEAAGGADMTAEIERFLRDQDTGSSDLPR